MSFILVLLFEQKQIKTTVMYAGNYWQTLWLTTPKYGRKKWDKKHETMMSDLWKAQVVHQIYEAMQITSLQQNWKDMP